MKFLLLTAVLAVSLTLCLSELHSLSDEFIKSINEQKLSWTAKRNFPPDTSLEHLQRLASLKGRHPDPNFKVPIKEYVYDVRDIPGQFDARNTWPQCESISQIRNQGACGSCWAFGAVEVMTDRLCIFSNGAKKFTFSAEELVSCCTKCGNGCSGGFLLPSFEYWGYNGIPSGGDEGSNIGCRPYTAASTGQTPQCNERCVGGYPKAWDQDIRHGIAPYEISPGDMQYEIMTNGPIEVSYAVYDDFYNYNTGVYQHTSGDLVGYHAVKVIGWGNENGLDYWLIANSWGSGWGGMGGFFKILRGSNHCGIEGSPTAGIPNVDE